MNRTLPRTAHALRRLPVLLLAAAALLLAAAVPARAAVTSELCPSCGAGWVLTYEHRVSRETLAAAPCAHGADGQDATVRIKWQHVRACTNCAWQDFGEPYDTTAEVCPLDTAPAAAEGTAAAPALSALALQKELLEQAQAAGLQDGQYMVAVAGRDRYLVRYHTAYADWDARPQGPLPRAVGSYTWQCAGYETDIRTLPFAQDWVAARPLAEDEDYGTGVLDWALPAVSQSAVYRRNSDQYILVTLRAGTPDPAAAPELVYQDFYDEDGDLLRCLWRDPRHRQRAGDGALRRLDRRSRARRADLPPGSPGRGPACRCVSLRAAF